MKICTAAQMRALDESAINAFSVSGMVLMENAGRSTVEAMVNSFGDPMGKKCIIFAGPGNNGGDGLVIARLLFLRGGRPEVFLLCPPEKLQGDAGRNLQLLRELDVPLHEIKSTSDLEDAEPIFHQPWTVVDALFGTGLGRDLSGHFASAVNRINRFTCPRIAVDIPSGLDADSGEIRGACVKADLTVTFALAKIGQVIPPGTIYCGQVVVADIGIPQAAVDASGIALELLDRVTGTLLPPRFTTAHKGTYGHLLCIAGSCGKTGAALLAGLGALRIGTGLVTLCVPHDLNHIFETALWEAMTVPLARSTGVLSADDAESVIENCAGKQAILIGPGLGIAPETEELVLDLYENIPLPMVVDADALTVLSRHPEKIAGAAGSRILTPHPGEMARLASTSATEIQENRLAIAGKFAQENKVFLVLKGSGTIISSPDGRQAINPTGNPGMGAGGMGDVLAGVLSGLLAQGLSCWDACSLGVFAHGLAGDRLARFAPCGYLAGELADELPETLMELAPSRTAL